MALDGIFLSAVKNEIITEALSSKVDKVYQPEKDEIIISLRKAGKNLKLLISAGANHPRVHFTDEKKDNPISAPMFCMLLRKHLLSGKLTDVYQPSYERVLRFEFLCYNELGDEVKKYLYVEIMGRYSNIIFTLDDDKIIDSIKHIDYSMSRQRQIMIGLQYKLPPPQDKLPISNENIEIGINMIKEKPDLTLDKALLQIFMGFSPLVCQELSYLISKQNNTLCSDINDEQYENLKKHLKNILKMCDSKKFSPTLLCTQNSEIPVEFCYMDITQYEDTIVTNKYNNFSDLLSAFYRDKDKKERIRQRASDITKTLTTKAERLSKKINIQTEELLNCSQKGDLMLFGDLITANMYKLKKGDDFLIAENFYDENSPEIKIPLDLSLSPSKNAQKYYKEYRKAKTAEFYLKEQIEKGQSELLYLDTVFEGLSKAENDKELNEIRDELVIGGYLKPKKTASKQKIISKPMEFLSSDGFTILAGKNNLQNDLLTLKTAKKDDLWFHTKNIPGSHTIIVSGGKNPPDTTITQAAQIAAFLSKAKASQNVPVDFTKIRNVKKPSGAKPGFVIYEEYKTLYVTPDPSLIENLRKG